MRAFWRRAAGSRTLQVVMGSLISALALYLSLRQISLAELARVFSLANWAYLGLSLLALGIHHGAKAFRWALLLEPVQAQGNPPVRVGDLLLSLLAGQMLNLVYPGRVGDLHRIWVIGNRGSGKAATAGTLVLEKTVDTIWFALLAAALAGLIAVPDWLLGGLVGLAAMLLSLWLLLFLFGREHSRGDALVAWLQRRNWLKASQLQEWVRSFQAGLAGLDRARDGCLFARLVFWTTLAWGMSLAINGLVAEALGVSFASPAQWLAAQILVSIGLQVGISVPSLPARIGVFEYICVLALSIFGIPAAEAFSYGLMLHVVVMLPLLLAGWGAMLALGRKS